MRLGGSIFEAANAKELEGLVDKVDFYGLGTVSGPWGYDVMPDEVLVAYGETACALGLLIGESHSRQNLLTLDDELQMRRIAELKEGMRKAELMGSHSVCILVGTGGEEDHLAAPHAFNYTEDAKARFRDAILRVMDGLTVEHTKLLIEPWPNTFFYQPEEIRAFLDSIGDLRVGLHLDLMNMVDQYHYYRTTELINETFDLLAPYIHAIHCKDLRWDWQYMYMKFDEVPVGEGVIDYRTYLRRISELGREIPCFVEHFQTEGEYATSFAYLHKIANENGTPFTLRK